MTDLSLLAPNPSLQASFDPPGLTVAVKKDRAMEPLLQVSCCFVTHRILRLSWKGAGPTGCVGLGQAV